ncbi:MAG TPA: TIGR03557 family F420-dependent LLM class oxidoreductase [Acidimicrobiales bacterium]|jgi:coenzyme F420-dependent glucose-6-phosphate dehydrogenase|nr:TIGR03557 family F420-dependent LLM class oxidoreductase [Acidimicrobiales bacterium]
MASTAGSTVEVGYALSSEEHAATDLVRHAARAEEAGFAFAGISDHFHPWTRTQGHSPFVWGVLGAIAQATERIRLGTGVTCPTVRMHPAVVAQAAATAACLMPGRFFLGVGSGEALNEHILGDRWPPADIRLEMLEEAIGVIRQLWQGGSQNHHGRHYDVEDATIFSLPDQPPGIIVAASGPRAVEVAVRAGDGMWTTSPDAELIDAFRAGGGAGKPVYGQATVCWAADTEQAVKTAMEIWPNAGISGQLSQDLPTPAHFEQAAQMVTEEKVTAKVVCGPEVERHVELVKSYADAGITHVYLHQVGPDQEGFFRFWGQELRPALAEAGLVERA